MIRIRQDNPEYWIATFDNRPINLMDPSTVYELDELLTRLESDPDVRVIGFDSANPDFFIAHWAFFVSTSRPGRSRLTALLEAGLQQDSEVERNLGRRVAETAL